MGLERDAHDLAGRPFRGKCGIADTRAELAGHDGDAAHRRVLVELGRRGRNAVALASALAVAIGEAPCRAFGDEREPVARRLIAQVVALVHRHEQIAGARGEREPDRRADAARVHAQVGAVGLERENRAGVLRRRRAVIARGGDPEQHPAVGCEREVVALAHSCRQRDDRAVLGEARADERTVRVDPFLRGDVELVVVPHHAHRRVQTGDDLDGRGAARRDEPDAVVAVVGVRGGRDPQPVARVDRERRRVFESLARTRPRAIRRARAGPRRSRRAAQSYRLPRRRHSPRRSGRRSGVQELARVLRECSGARRGSRPGGCREPRRCAGIYMFGQFASPAAPPPAPAPP